ncbi:MAG: hypothetical protein HBSAPP04_11290 [Ignavibacteriaceae bacterium]|nr:MAG: hypothetical protein HBSAPP04_11290 [Ignavibacteriaceae bacterium]
MLRSGWGAPAIDDTIVEAIIYNSDGHQVHGYLAYPKTVMSDELLAISDQHADTHGLNRETQSGEESHFTFHISHFPCLVWNRGGSKERGAIDRFTAVGMFGQLASWGFVVFASMYRATFERDSHDEFGGSEVNDILNLMEIANDIPFADTSRWAMEGWSRGGMMTYLALRKRHDVKAAIISGGITDVAECCTTVPRIQAAIQHVIETEGPAAQENRSAIHFADELPRDCKYLIIHGTKDDTVPPTQALKITSRFLELGMHFRLVLLEEGDHFLKGKKKEVDQLRKEWLLKYV